MGMFRDLLIKRNEPVKMRSFVVEASSSPICELGGDASVIDELLSHGSYVIDEVHKKYARLSETDSDTFAGGTAWSGTYGDAFRYLPKIWIKKDKTYTGAGTRYYVSNKPLDESYALPDSWVGMYKGSYDANGALRSRPRVLTKENQTMTQFWEAAQKIGVDYGLVNYFDHQKINALHLAKFGNMNSDMTVGIGLSNAGKNYANHQTGATASVGNGTGTSKYLTTNYSMVRLFGIEDLFGTTWEFRPNIRFDGGQAIIYEGNIVSNTAEGVRTFVRLQTASQQYITKMALGDNFDLIAIAVGGNSASYWCDGAWANAAGHILLVSGSVYEYLLAGLTCSASTSAFSLLDTNVGARLAFKGDINDYQLVTGAELASLHS